MRGELLKFFPFEKPRNNQLEIIQHILDCYEKGNKHYILEAPTGTGKSVIAYTAGKYLLNHYKIENDPLDKPSKYDETYPKCIILTHNKSLQQQYVDSFKGLNVESIWSSENYPCAFDDLKDEVSYGSPGCLKKKCNLIHLCPYQLQKKKFLKSDIGICNYHYFLQYCEMKTRYLILDEAHNLEHILCDIAEVKTSNYLLWSINKTLTAINEEYEYGSCLGLLREFVKKKSVNKNDMRDFFKQFIPKIVKSKLILDRHISRLEIDLAKDPENQKLAKKLGPLGKMRDAIEDYCQRVSRFHLYTTDWIRNESIETKEKLQFNIKPLFVNEFFSLLQNKCEYMLMMSATICVINQFVKNIGVSEYRFTYTDMPIPIQNRPVYNHSIGYINHANKHEILPKFIAYMDSIIDQLTNNWSNPQGGIIHTISRENAKYVIDHSKYKDKIIIPTKEQLLNLDELLKDANKIIVSYNMLEGIDLKDDKSRFQFFIKMPYLNLGDEWIKAKRDLDIKWYNRECIIKVVQGSGRSIRSEQDWAYTFILDSNFNRLLNQDKELFPKWFLDAVQRI